MKFQLDAGIETDIPEIVDCLVNAQARFLCRTKSTLPKMAARNTRGPILFKFVRVDYDKTQGKLKLSNGEFPGHAVRDWSNTEDGYETSEQHNWYTGKYAEPAAGALQKEDCYAAGRKIPKGDSHMKWSGMFRQKIGIKDVREKIFQSIDFFKKMFTAIR